MARRALPFTQADVTRAVKGTLAAGLPVERVETRRDGTIVVITTAGALTAYVRRDDEPDDEPNDFDKVL